MSKVIILSRYFPEGHPRAGEPTFFVEQTWASLRPLGVNIYSHQIDIAYRLPIQQYSEYDLKFLSSGPEKHHTIRAGKRWKTGDKASLRVWSDRPYRSKQIAIAPDVELVVKDIEISAGGMVVIDGKGYSSMFHPDIAILSKNDGLIRGDFVAWFSILHPLPFSGQILCWNAKNLPY